MPQMVCYEGNEDGFWLLWIVAAVGFCAFAIFVPAVLAEILYKVNRPAPAAAGYPEETADAVMDDPGLRGADFLQAHGWLVLRFRYVRPFLMFLCGAR